MTAIDFSTILGQTILENLSRWLQEWAPIIGSLGSLLLTGMLVYLYKLQSKILEKQTQLTENQHKSILRVDDYFLASAQDMEKLFGGDETVPDLVASSDLLMLELSNFGKGAAEGIRSELYLKDGGLSFHLNSVMIHGGNMDPIAFSDQDGVLGAEERNVMFGSWFKTEKDEIPEEWRVSEDAPEWLSPTEILWNIYDSGTRYIELGIEIHYEDGTGTRDPILLFANEVDLRECRDIRAALIKGEPLLGENQ